MPIFVRYLGNESYLYGTTFDELIKKAIKGKPIIAGAYSTVLHSILFAVLTMGAKKIHLIGIDHSKSGDKTYYSLAQSVEANHSNKLRVAYRRESWYRPEMCDRQKYGAERFIEICRQHGIIINRYRDYDDWRLNNVQTQLRPESG